MDDHPYTDHTADWIIAKHMAECPQDADNPRWLKLKLSFQQPSASPEFGGHDDLDHHGLIHPPGVYASNERFMEFRDETVIPCLGSHPIWAIYLRRVEMILEWRAAVPVHLRFWRSVEMEERAALMRAAKAQNLSDYAFRQ